MVEEYSAAYWMGSLLADELLFNGRGRKWMQRKVSSIIKLTEPQNNNFIRYSYRTLR